MADGTPLTEEGLARALKNLQKQSAPSTSPSSSGVKDFDATLVKATSELNPFGSALKNAGSTAAAGIKTLQSAVEDGLDTWRNLSKSGVSFNNDIIGMTTAAAGTRLPLAEFAGLVKENAASFAGLGGSVTRGAEAFAKMSKGFFESGATDSLKQLGYTNKELNEILAIQSVSVRGIVKDEGERNRVAYESATKLATEMDSMAKLTGKSREEQTELLKKQQTDMQFDAAIRLKARQIDDPVKRAEFEANARNQLMQAEREGRGQMFKEYFAFGNVISKEAGTQASLMQEQAAATRKAAMATADTRAESADREARANEAQNEARMAAVRDANDVNKLQLRQLGAVGGPVADTLNKQALVMNTYTQALEKVAKENELDLNNKADLKKAQELATAEVKKAAAGQDAAGKQVDGSTKALVQFGNTVDHVRAGLMTGLLNPVRDTISPELGRLGENLKTANRNFQGQGQIGAAVEKAATAGVRAGEQPAGDRRQAPVEEGGVLGAVKTAGTVIGAGASGGRAGLKKLNETIERRATGGPVEANEPYIVGDGGEEELFVPKVAGDIIPKSKIANMFSSRQADMLQQIKTDMPSLDIAGISKNISTSVSGMSGAIKGPNLKELAKPFESAFGDFGLKFSSIANSVGEKFKQSKLPESFDKLGVDISQAVSSVSEKINDTKYADMFDEFGSNFDEVVAKMANDISSNTVFDEFGSNFDEVVAKMADKISDTSVFDEFGSNFDEVVAKMAIDIKDSLPLDVMSQTEAALDFAKKRRQELEDIMNDGQARSGAEWDEIFDEAEQLDGQIEKLTTKQIEAMSNYGDSWDTIDDLNEKIMADIEESMPVDTEFGDLEGAMKRAQGDQPYDEFAGLDEAIARQSQPYDEFAGLDEAISKNMSDVIAGSSPTTSQASKSISLDSFTLGKNGLPIAKPKSVSAATPDKKPEEKKASPGKAINPETGEEYTPVSAADASSKGKTDSTKKGSDQGDAKAATLDDVVKALSALNSKMGQLISTTETGHKEVAKAAKSNSSNIYAR